eukprot:gene1341-1748_t
MRHSAIATADQLDNRTKEWQEADHVRAESNCSRDGEGVFMAAAEHQAHSVDRRDFIYIATGAFGAVGAGAVAWPFISQMNPDRSTIAAGAPVEVDIAGMAVGEMKTVEWRGKPVWILKRSDEMVKSLSKLNSEMADPDSKRDPAALTPEYARNEHRSRKPEFLVAVGICSHLGCSPTTKLATGPQPNLPDDWNDGFLCPCHGSTFDLAGRVYKNKPAPDNLEVPPHMYLSDN